ncbi:fibronectin type iii domain-containing 3ba-related [Anaeramoeba flamelloides]|uniref:Fibronectin type iii domain-containing 3ba-related n=1 Tax=Anaeramoeba flamelloides TaxID=1746091 RepID=A0ABQ8YY32_9EUKA|nr:fibronectin type iii domain-containing 3ba-related [Anaeramoeba flamelloides]
MRTSFGFLILVILICVPCFCEVLQIYRENESIRSVSCDIVVKKDGSDNNDCKSYNTACQSIEKGLEESGSDDNICVYEGTYYISKTLSVNHQQLISISGSAKTKIDGSSSRKCIDLVDQNSFEIDGFTIQHCVNNGGEGGAIKFRCYSAITYYPKIKNCIIQNNYAEKGGGIYNGMCCPTLENVIIRDNEATESGGGLYCLMNAAYNHPHLTFTNVTIAENTGSGQKNVEDKTPSQGGGYSCKVNGDRLYDCDECYNGGGCQPNGECMCLPGSSTPSPECEYCTPGTYSSTYNSPDCTPCEVGTYNDADGATGCRTCPDGTGNLGTGNTYCSPNQCQPVDLIGKTATSLTVQWAEPETNFPINGYKLQYKQNDSDFWSVKDFDNDVFETKITNLYSGQYNFQVSAFNDEGVSEYSTQIDYETSPATTPSQITDVQEITSGRSSTCIEIEWGKPNHGGSQILNYEINYQKAESNENQTITISSGDTLQSDIASLLSGDYYIKIRSNNSVGYSDWSNIFIFSTNDAISPSAINDLSGTDKGSDWIQLQWTIPCNGGSEIENYELLYINDDGSTNHNVNANSNINANVNDEYENEYEDRDEIEYEYVDEDEDGWDQIIIKSGSISEYELSDLYSGTYQIKIRALNGIEPKSNFSNIITSTTLKSTAPDEIKVIEQIDRTCDSLSIEWEKPDHGGSKIFNYKIYYNQYVYETNNNDTSFIFKDLLSGKYNIQIQAENEIGFGNISNEYLFKTDPAQVPSIVSGINKIDSSSINLTIDWGQPTRNGSPITNYTISYKKNLNTSVNWNIINTGNNDTVYKITDLNSDQEYMIKICANNIVGSGEESEISIFKVDHSTKPYTINPSPIEINKTSTSITIQWDKPFNGNSTITSYQIAYRTPTASDFNIETLAVQQPISNVETYVIDNLLSDTYEIKVLATNNNGDGNYSDIVELKTNDPCPPTSPINFKQLNKSCDSMTIQWEKPINNGGSKIFNYQIKLVNSSRDSQNYLFNYNIDDNTNSNSESDNNRNYQFYQSAVQEEGDIYSFILNNIYSDEYKIYLFAENEIGMSNNISTIMETNKAKAPGSVSDLKKLMSTSTTITISFNNAAHNGRKINYYYIQYVNLNNAETQTKKIVPINDDEIQKVELNDLLDSDYQIKVFASNMMGNGTIETLTTNPDPPVEPSQVENVKGENSTPTNIYLTWDQPNNGGSKIINYKIKSNNTDEIILINSTLNHYNLTVSESGNYWITIKAINEIGESQFWSDQKTFSTGPATAPSKIINVRLSEQKRKYLVLNWENNYSGGKPIIEYEIKCLEIDEAKLTSNKTIKTKNLDPGTLYNFQIKAKNIIGWSNINNFQFETLSQYPTKLDGLKVVESEPYTLLFGWNEPNDTDITSYNVKFLSKGTIYENIINNNYLLTDLIPNNSYQVQVRSQIDQYSGNWSDTFTMATQKNVPEMIDEITCTTTDIDYFTLHWDTPRNNGYSIDYWKISIREKNNQSNSWSQIFDANKYSNQAKIDGLSHDTIYQISMISHNQLGESQVSNTFEFQTKDVDKKDSNMDKYIIGFSISGSLLFVIVILAVLFYRRRKVIKMTPQISVYKVFDDQDDNDEKELNNMSSEEIEFEDERLLEEEEFISNLTKESIQNDDQSLLFKSTQINESLLKNEEI